MKFNQISALLAVCVLAGGCMMGPNYRKPQVDLPEETASADYSVFTTVKWWEAFNDPILNQMEEEALQYNKDLRVAMARVDEARANVGVAVADQLPGLSVAGETGRAGNARGSGQTQSTAGAVVSFELDLWGKYRRLSEAARAQLLASEANRDNVRLALTANVARGYFSLRALDEQLNIATRTLQTRQESVRVYQSRYENGYCTEVDLRRIEASMASVQAQQQELKLSIEKAETALTVLLGRSPRAMVQDGVERGQSLAAMTLVPDVPEGLPSDLLARRPDVRQAEGQLMAANANIGAARAAYFPSIPLTASAGYASAALNQLFTGGQQGVWALTAKVTGPIFAGGKIRSQNKAVKAKYVQMLATYEKTVQGAFKEALDAIAANKINRDVFDSYQQQTRAMRRSYDLTKKQEEAGLIDVTDLLNVESTLLSAEMSESSARLNELNSVVTLCQALGGGWNQNDGFSTQEKTK